MVCPSCGRDIPQEARFCPYCGSQLRREDCSPRADLSQQSATTPPVPVQATDAKIRRRRIAIIAGMCALGLVLATMLGSSIIGRLTSSFGASSHPVTFRAIIDDLGDASSRIPARITGTTTDGTEVDMELFLARDGTDCELASGSYHLKVLGSPIAEDGTLFEVALGEIDFEVPERLRRGEAYTVPATKTLFFNAIDAEKVTDEQIADAVAWARKDDDPKVDPDALERAARDHRDHPPVVLDTEASPMA